jgi:hypothetical protein
VKTTVHPNSREYKVVIKVATDPVRFSPLG